MIGADTSDTDDKDSSLFSIETNTCEYILKAKVGRDRPGQGHGWQF